MISLIGYISNKRDIERNTKIHEVVDMLINTYRLSAPSMCYGIADENYFWIHLRSDFSNCLKRIQIKLTVLQGLYKVSVIQYIYTLLMTLIIIVPIILELRGWFISCVFICTNGIFVKDTLDALSSNPSHTKDMYRNKKRQIKENVICKQHYD